VLPVVSDTLREQVLGLAGNPSPEWRKEMIHRLKEMNPEVNALLLELAQGANDPKLVVMAGYAVYQALELALQEEDELAAGI
jgi:hypothetical protein